MGFVIRDKKFTGKLTNEYIATIVNAIKALPMPTIVAREKFSLNSDDELALCLQREVIYFDTFHPVNNIKYLGSKSVDTCILAYIHTDTDHLLIHFDNTMNINLKALLSRFNYKQNIKVTLVGGIPGALSENNLKQVVVCLYQASIALNINIEIEYQMLMQSNRFSHEDKKGFIFDKLFYKADILSRQYFNKPLNKELLKDRKISDFNRSIPLTQELTVLLAALSQATEIYDVKKQSKINFLNQMLQPICKDEELFYSLLNMCFSKEAFGILDTSYEESKLYPDSPTCNCAFELDTGKIYVIDHYINTPYETIRTIVPIDPYQEPIYFVCYDEKSGTYQEPKLSEAYLKECLELKPAIHDGVVLDRDALAKKFRIPNNIAIINAFGLFIKSLNSEYKSHVAQTNVTFFSFFKATKSISETYSNNEVVTQNLNLLKEITDVTFIAKERHYPNHTIDALLFSDNNTELLKIHYYLWSINIQSHIIKFSNSDNYCLNVPAINVEWYGNAIQQQKGLKLT